MNQSDRVVEDVAFAVIQVIWERHLDREVVGEDAQMKRHQRRHRREQPPLQTAVRRSYLRRGPL
jgi:hypothetical protein